MEKRNRVVLTFTSEEAEIITEWYKAYVSTCKGQPLSMNKWIKSELMEAIE